MPVARANDVAMDDETSYCDCCFSADSTVDTDPALHPAGQPEAIKGHAAAQGASSSGASRARSALSPSVCDRS